jgi:hypothetical protein
MRDVREVTGIGPTCGYVQALILREWLLKARLS